MYLAGGPLFALQSRIWCAGTEHQLEATYGRELLGGVQVRNEAGKSTLIRFEQLSEADRNYLKYNVPPSIDLDIDYSTRVLGRTEWSRDDDDTTLYTFTVSVEKKSSLPYAGRLNVELFVLGNERVIEDDSRLVLMAYRRKSFVLPEGDDVPYEFTVPEVSFNSYRAGWILKQAAVERGKTYRGVIAAVSDSDGNLIEIECDFKLDWITKDLPESIENLRTLYQEHPGGIESRHFNSRFKKLSPPSIPWFQRFHSD